MPSFDCVSEVNLHEVRNAVDQANRELETRFDFKGIAARFELLKEEIVLHGEQEFHLRQMMDILRQKLAKRGVDISSLESQEPQGSLKAMRQSVRIRQGIDGELAKKLVKAIKDGKLKVQTQIQGDQLRVTGKKRDDLQQAIALLRAGDFGLPLQFINFRD